MGQSFPLQRTSERIEEQTVDFPVQQVETVILEGIMTFPLERVGRAHRGGDN